MFPYSAAGHRADRRGDQRPGDQRAVHRRAAADPARLLRHVHPVARRRRRATARRSARLLGAGRLAPRGPRGDRGRAAAVGRARRSRSRACASCSTRSPTSGMVAEAPQEAREQIVHALRRLGPRGARRDHDAARADAVALLRAARPRHRPQPELGRDRLPGAAAPPPAEPKPLAVRRPEPAPSDDDRGRRLRRRLGRRRRRDRRRARRRPASRSACSRWAATTTRPTSTSSSSGPTSTSTCAAGRSRPPRARSRSWPAPSLGGGTVINWTELPAHLPLGARGVGARARARGPRRARLRPPPRRVWSASASTTRCSDLNGPHQRLKEGCEALGYDFQLDHPQRRPGAARPRAGRLHGLRRRTGLEALDPEDLPRRRARARRRPRRQLPRRADPGRGRARGRGRGRPTTGARRRDGAGSWSARRRSSSPAARSSRRRCCCARGSAARRSATTCACTRRAP